jgi:4'-phosphopantetheinyl transferase
MALWLIPRREAPDAKVTLTERECSWADSLGAQRAEQFAHSRRWLRSCLADRFRLCSDRIPLEAPPGHPPTLAAGWGWISISHTRDALLLGWSSQRIGVDLERHDRSFAAEALCRRFFCADDRDALLRLAAAERRPAVLQHWITKEAAIKWQRGKLATDLDQWSLSETIGMAVHRSLGLRLKVHYNSVGDWCLAVVGVDFGPGQPPPICRI